MKLVLGVLVTLPFVNVLVSSNAISCDTVEIWRMRRNMGISEGPSTFTELYFEQDSSFLPCGEACTSNPSCRGANMDVHLSQRRCQLYNHTVLMLQPQAGVSAYIKDYYKEPVAGVCPQTVLWDPPAGWPSDAVPAFYQPLESDACIQLQQTNLNLGKKGKGISSDGSGYADLVTPDLVESNPDLYLWMKPELSPDGMSVALWYKYAEMSGTRGIITTRGLQDSTVTQGFAIYFVNAKLVAKVHRQTGRRAATLTDLNPIDGTWYHFGITYDTTAENIVLYVNGAGTQGAAETNNAGYVGPYTLRIGTVNVDHDDLYGAGTWDEVLAFNSVLSPQNMALLAG